MITDKQKQDLYIEAAGLVLNTDETSLEAQVAILKMTNSMEIHVPGVEPCELYEYYNAKNLLKEIAAFHYTLINVFEAGVKSVTEIKPNIQHIK